MLYGILHGYCLPKALYTSDCVDNAAEVHFWYHGISSPALPIMPRPTLRPAFHGTLAQRQQVFDFLDSIGLAVRQEEGTGGFLRGVKVEQGGLVVSSKASIDAILHEAGHLAIVPQPFRHLLDDDIDVGVHAMLSAIEAADLEHDDPLRWAAMHTSDVEASAWSWAVGRHLGLPEELVILNSSYGKDGAGIRTMLRMGQYAGIHGLQHAGMCHHGFGAKLKGLSLYPLMQRWTQEGPYPSFDRCQEHLSTHKVRMAM
jgi:hypothetical protein